MVASVSNETRTGRKLPTRPCLFRSEFLRDSNNKSNNKSNNAKIHNPTELHPFPMTLARAENSAISVVLIFQYCFGFQQQVKQAYNNTNNRVYKNRRQKQKTNTIKRLYAIHKDTPRAPTEKNETWPANFQMKIKSIKRKHAMLCLYVFCFLFVPTALIII